MPLSRKVRAFLAVSAALTRVGVLPDARRAAALPLHKRLSLRPPSWAVDPWPDGITTEDDVVGDLRLRFYTPLGANGSAVLWIHGGGWSVGGLAGTDHICATVAAETGAVLVAVEYRLAPQYGFPAALDDCWTALTRIRESAAARGLDVARVGIAGDSAGGGLAAGLALRCRDEGVPVAAQVLIYPALDSTRSTPAARTYPGPGLTAGDLGVCWELYAGDLPDDSRYLSPLLEPDLSGLPPTLVVTAYYDPLRDEGPAYAGRLLEAGVRAELKEFPDYLHGFLSIPRLYQGVDAAWAVISAFLRAELVPTAGAGSAREP
ncbi:MAG: alpha/beta hydrolase [Actinomycetota bacterium]|nr:alpha/beta hydrolase [Actinomycetota bacterium]